MSIHDVPRAPITDIQRAKLRRDIANIERVAKRKGLSTSPYDIRLERNAGQYEFELGCWFWWAARRQYDRDHTYVLSIEDRAKVVVAMLLSGRTSVNYEFHTVFNFGERDFDTFFEMNDGTELVQAIIKKVRALNHPTALTGLKAMGWDHPRYETKDLFSVASEASA